MNLRVWTVLVAVTLLGACGGDSSSGDRADGVTVDGDWAVITGNLMGQRYSDLTQINPSNVADLIAQDDIDGFLVGGASLDSEKFSVIIDVCASVA